MRAEMFERIMPKRTRQFDTWNVLGIMVSIAMLAMAAVVLSNNRRPVQFQDLAFLASAIASGAIFLEPAFPRDHAAARTLRVVSIVTLAIAIIGAITMFLPVAT